MSIFNKKTRAITPTALLVQMLYRYQNIYTYNTYYTHNTQYKYSVYNYGREPDNIPYNVNFTNS